MDLDRAFHVENGLVFDSGVAIVSGDADPSVSLVDAPLGSIYIRVNGELFQKTGAGVENWVKQATAAGVEESIAVGALNTTASGNVGFYVIKAPETSVCRTISGTTGQTVVTNGDGQAGDPTISIADNPVIPGTQRIRIPSGTQSERPSGSPGDLRFNSTISDIEYYNGQEWRQPLSTPLFGDFTLRDSSASSVGRRLVFQKDRAGGSATIGDSVGGFLGQAWNGSEYVDVVETTFEVDGLMSAGGSGRMTIHSVRDGVKSIAATVFSTGHVAFGPVTTPPSSKKVCISDTAVPTFTAAAQGLGISYAGGGGIFFRNSTDGVEGKFESWAGAIGIGVSNIAARLQMYASNNSVPDALITTGGALIIGRGAVAAPIISGVRLEVAGGDLSINNASVGSTGAVLFKELDANGNNAVSLRAPASLGTSFSLVLPATPPVPGDTFVVDGMGHLSFSAPTSNLNRVVLHEDWISATTAGATGWKAFIKEAGAAVSLVTTGILPEYNAVGLVSLSTGSKSNGIASLSMGSNLVFGSLGQTVQARMAIGTFLSTSVQTYRLTFGLNDGEILYGLPSNGAYFLYDSTQSPNWLIVCSANGSRTQLDSGVLVHNTSFVTFRIVVNPAGTQVDFYIGTTVAALQLVGAIDANIPAPPDQTISPCFKIWKTNGNIARNFIVDYCTFDVAFTDELR